MSLVAVEASHDLGLQSLDFSRIGGIYHLLSEAAEFLAGKLTAGVELFGVVHDLRKLCRRQAVNLMDDLDGSHGWKIPGWMLMVNERVEVAESLVACLDST